MSLEERGAVSHMVQFKDSNKVIVVVLNIKPGKYLKIYRTDITLIKNDYYLGTYSTLFMMPYKNSMFYVGNNTDFSCKPNDQKMQYLISVYENVSLDE